MRSVMSGIRRLQGLRSDELMAEAKRLQAPYELVARGVVQLDGAPSLVVQHEQPALALAQRHRDEDVWIGWGPAHRDNAARFGGELHRIPAVHRHHGGLGRAKKRGDESELAAILGGPGAAGAGHLFQRAQHFGDGLVGGQGGCRSGEEQDRNDSHGPLFT